ncbi:hypothetical protein [Mucilaginibacter paludis]|uniref:Secreted protein n=1 Tax=Mucilaginibacter paludis DSM 18603 TaxID=714943 RepID=H1YA68_9SPHI|nr:hypothetical protein [Mucilaginibacter paludis]EHQ25949.1 hypothetical protein Mucpa_1795 [Mucilaginibacter paludis DSM 18603]
MKTLKLIIALPLMALFIQNAAANGQSTGLYLTTQDYLNHKLSYNASNDQIKVNGLLGSSKVLLVHNGEKQAIAKGEVFGYRKDDKDFRLFNKGEYKILSSNGIIIYSKTSLVLQGKGPKPIELFYFSESASSPILSLTIANLESVYAKNQKFMYAVESLFKSDSELSSYDAYNKQFKLAYLYTENTK